MTKQRLETLLYNAIILLEESGYDDEELQIELGITKEEYEKMMEN